ncbi:type III secretion system chaperone family protein [Salinactinospora qingdaonensis]|uniref:Uncharacterized protein n=1 Tax=Salinactinospora qingdaonensis TaxID=702744 RepID=A0ABP7FYR9_9ACTN
MRRRRWGWFGPQRNEPADETAAATGRQAMAQAHGWHYVPHDQRVIVGWPRTALPPGPVGRVCDAVFGDTHGRAFTVFDYAHRSARTGQGERLLVWAMELPGRAPYVRVRCPPGDTHDIYVESGDTDFALRLLSTEVREEIRRHAFTGFVVDSHLLIHTAAEGGPEGIEDTLKAMAELIEHLPEDLWSS